MSVFTVKINDELELRGNDYSIENPIGILVAITGMNEHSERYEEFARYLNTRGLSVYMMDHFGQGTNVDHPDKQEIWPRGEGVFDLEVLALSKKVEEVKKYGVPVYLMGHSMGSFSTQRYLQNHSGTVSKAVIMGSNGRNNKLAIAAGAMLTSLLATDKNWDERAPMLENLILGPFIKSVKDRTSDNEWISYNKENVKKYDEDPFCGHYNTYGFFYGMMHGFNELYKKDNLAKVDKSTKILIVAGQDDPVGANGKGPKELEKMYKELGLKEVDLILYQNMRHEILNEVGKEKVMEDIADFLLK